MTDTLTCPSCNGRGSEWNPLYSSGRSRPAPCTYCDGTGTLDRRQVALTIARAHGTRVAVEFTNLSTNVVRRIRRDTDGHRTAGRPSRADIEAMAPRLDCTCPYCLEHRAELSHKINHTISKLVLDRPALRGEWRDHAACADADPDLFFPSRGESIGEALSYCRRCPVRDACLDAGLDEHYGIWGGLSERGRRRARRLRRAKRDAA